MKKNILFVCKYNRFRSQVAEQFFNKHNKNQGILAKSAGIFKGKYPLDKLQVEAAKKLEINIGKEPETISANELGKTDMIVIVSDEIPKDLFKYNRKYLQAILFGKSLTSS
ncbi:MAG: hypothetical protein KJ879_02600 [Nanoarchaeota archaeon]|nr:hypothetical protein [Nanoarchaeota archaeon]